MKVSVIIAVKKDNPNLRECIARLSKIAYQNYEILVLPDEAFVLDQKNLRIIPTGNCLPAKKRDVGAENACGEILAFIDDDAYPSENWLDEAVKDFEDLNVGAVGGPAVTPPNENFKSRAGGYVYASWMVSGNFSYRYIIGKKQAIDDYPSCNLLVRKEIFKDIGGFKMNFWPGEDTFLCLEIIKKGKKIIYEPGALVFHHRRPLFLSHLKQISSYGLHRGYFVKRFPENSLRWQYFIPSLFLIWFLFGLLFSFVSYSFGLFYLFSIILYSAIAFLSSKHENDPKMTFLVFSGTFLSHLSYGLFFIIGLLSKRLNEERE